MTEVQLQTGPGVFEVLAHVCRSPLEAFKQFVENSADAVEQVGEKEGYIRIDLHQEAASDGLPKSLRSIAIEDNGVGMGPDKMRAVLQTIGDSEKLNLTLRGEKGIGLLAFALIATEVHLASTDTEGKPSSCLVLKQEELKAGRARIVDSCPLHTHSRRGTTVHLMGILPEIAPYLAKERIKNYLGREFARDLRANLYTMLIRDNQRYEPIEPQHFRGVRALALTLPLDGMGHVSLELYTLPLEAPDAAVSLYGRGGTRVCHLMDLADFKRPPWTDRRLEGYVHCDRLKRTADKTAIVQDKAFLALVVALHHIEHDITKHIDEMSREYQERRLGTIMRRVERFITRFVSYLEDRTTLDKVLPPAPQLPGTNLTPHATPKLLQPQTEPGQGKQTTGERVIRTPSVLIRFSPPSADKEPLRSWYDPATSTICINQQHTDFLEARRDDRRCAWYLFNIWAKERLLADYGSDAYKLADEMVGLLTDAEPLFSQLLSR